MGIIEKERRDKLNMLQFNRNFYKNKYTYYGLLFSVLVGYMIYKGYYTRPMFLVWLFCSVSSLASGILVRK